MPRVVSWPLGLTAELFLARGRKKVISLRACCCVSAVCEDMLGGLTALLGALTGRSTTALIGSVDPALCETVAKLAARQSKFFITWSCPQVNYMT
jgi:hypothetical protein